MSEVVLLALPLLCAALYFWPRPAAALRNYLTLLPFLPEFLVVDAGVAITGSRISSFVFLLAMLYRATDRLIFRIDRLDIVIAAFLIPYLVAVIPGPPEGGAVFAAGFLLDVAVPYYFVRCLVRTTADMRELVRGLLLPAGAVVACAAFQSVTGIGLFDAFKTGDGVFGNYDSGMRRLGLVRADVGLSHYIMMGMWFASLLPIAMGHFAGHGLRFGRALLKCWLLPLGAFFSLSGGSFLVTAIGLGTYSSWPLRRLFPLLGVLGLAGVVFIETFSNRGTMAILATLAATDGDSAWYRIRLPAAVFGVMPGHWLTGFGRDKPPMGIYNDITNHYLWWLMQAGLPAMLAFIGAFLVSFQRLVHAARTAVTSYLESLSWGLGAALLALGLGLMTVSLFGQMRSYLFVYFAMAACAATAAAHERRSAVVVRVGHAPVSEPACVVLAASAGDAEFVLDEDDA